MLENVNWSRRIPPGCGWVDGCYCFEAVEFLETGAADYGDVDGT